MSKHNIKLTLQLEVELEIKDKEVDGVAAMTIADRYLMHSMPISAGFTDKSDYDAGYCALHVVNHPVAI